MRIEVKGLIAALTAALVVIGGVFSLSAIVTRAGGASSIVTEAPSSKSSGKAGSSAIPTQLVTTGHSLFTQDCASCHGSKGQGGFGPSLYNSDLTDPQIAMTIKNGIKPRMPAFGSQYKDPQIQALTAYIRSLKK